MRNVKHVPEEDYFQHVMLAAGVSKHTIAKLRREVIGNYRNSAVSHRERVELSPEQYLNLIMKRAGFNEEEIKEVADQIRS